MFIRFIFYFIILLISSKSIFLKYNLRNTGTDDANIFFVYAQNFINGFGFRFNKIDELPVEGFTSFLYTLIVSASMYFSDNFLEVLYYISLMFTALGVSFYIQTIEKYLETHNKKINIFIHTIICSLIFGPIYFTAWNINSLMDNGLYFLQVMILFRYSYEHFVKNEFKKNFILLLPLFAIGRPELAILTSIYLFSFFLYNYIKKNSLNQSFFLGFYFLIILSIVTLLRLFYFGSLLPNTYYAKATFGFYTQFKHGLGLSFQFLINNITLCLYLFIPIFFKFKNKKLLIINYSFILFIFIIILITGGDHFSGYRLFQPYILFFITPIILTINKFKYYFLSERNLLIIILFMVNIILNNSSFVLLSKYKFKINSFYSEFYIVRYDSIEANLYNDFFSTMNTYPSVATVSIGSFGFNYKGYVYDIIGLVHYDLAKIKKENDIFFHGHSSFNKRWFLSKDIDLVKIRLPTTFDTSKAKFKISKFDNTIFKDIFYENKFIERYELYSLKVNNNKLVAFVNKKYVKKLSKKGVSLRKIDYL